MKKIQWKPLIISLLISLGTGALSGFVTKDSMEMYKNIAHPPLSPKGIVFPIVWTILFVLMGISAYLIFIEKKKKTKTALVTYGIQLVLNFFWPVIFFTLQMYLAAFLWLIALLVAVIVMTVRFSKIIKTAAYLQIPYVLWLVFAAYLNLGVYLLNK